MDKSAASVQSHYASPDLLKKIRAGLEQSGKVPEQISPRDLAPVDQLHTGGAPATISLINTWLQTCPQTAQPEILDAGCGTGGSARLLADQFNCRVRGIDLSEDFIETAAILTQWCGLSDKASFCQGSILELPYEDRSFDGVLCQHVLMNIQEKERAVNEFYRVLRPGGSLIFHDITNGEGPDLLMPVPWASDLSTSFLVSWEETAEILAQPGFSRVLVSDETDAAARWWQKINARPQKADARPSLHPGLVFGKNAARFGPNMEQNFSSRAVCCISAILKKP